MFITRRPAPCSIRQILLVSLTLISSTLAQTCYFPDGSVATGDIPCNNGASSGDKQSTCCGPDWRCTEMNICESGTGNYARGSCTDPTFQDDSCPKFCTQQNTDNAIGLSYCSGNSSETFMCCNYNNVLCDCSSNDVYVFGPDIITTTLPTVAPPPPTSAASASTNSQAASASTTPSSSISDLTNSQSGTTPATTSNTGTANSGGGGTTTKYVTATPGSQNATAGGGSSGLSTGAAAGVGVGVALAVIAVVVLAAVLLYRHRKSKQNKAYSMNNGVYSPHSQPSWYAHSAQTTAAQTGMQTPWGTAAVHDTSMMKYESVPQQPPGELEAHFISEMDGNGTGASLGHDFKSG